MVYVYDFIKLEFREDWKKVIYYYISNRFFYYMF